MKKTILFLIFLFVCLFIFSQESEGEELVENNTKKINMKENTQEANEYMFVPTFGHSSVGITTGLDFIYRKSNGFTIVTNLNLSVPETAEMGGIIVTSEYYIGHTLKQGNFYASLLAGTWLGGGVSFHGYDSRMRNGSSTRKLIAQPEIIVTIALRGDYTFFFNKKLGIHFSHAHGFGPAGVAFAMDARNYPKARLYSFMLKLGLAIKVWAINKLVPFILCCSINASRPDKRHCLQLFIFVIY